MIVALLKTIFWGTIATILATPLAWIVLAYIGFPVGGGSIIVLFFCILIFFYCAAFEAFYQEESLKNKIYFLNTKISKDPNNIELYLHRGDAYLGLKEYDIAISDYECVINKQSANLLAYCGLINAYENLKKYEIAINYCYELIKTIPEYQEVYLTMAKLKNSKGDYKSAITDLDYFISIDRQNIEAHKLKAYICYWNLKDYNNAAISYKNLIQLNPNEPDNFRWAAYCFKKIGDLKQAKENYQTALMLYEKYELTDSSFYTDIKESLKEIDASLYSNNNQKKLTETDIDVEAFYGNRYENDFIYWCYKTNYEPDDAGAYDAWIEEKQEERSSYFTDDDD
ncbi:MAG: hypothetical protein V7L14_21345 [Nostoc sp.]|uniref:tetratricopeptide repeat protein n=1 Tax=Nostoc sp. TaxID=1180 RepID=UPI002FFB7006